MGGVLAWAGGRKQRGAIGIKATRISKRHWGFSLRSRDVASNFAPLNPSLVADLQSPFGNWAAVAPNLSRSLLG